MREVSPRAIAELTHMVESEIGNLNFKQEPKQLYEPIEYILSLGGKRLRPVLLLLACEMYDKPANLAIPQALAIEIFHNFTLVHDDIMDKAPKRRNQPTVHTKWNENTGILSGDVMLICAYQHLCKGNQKHLQKLLELFNKTAIEVCEGQQFDMNYETDSDITIEQYIRMIDLKTAVLLGCSLQTGSIIADASDSDQTNIYEFGRNLGIAFQLQDDLLDVYGDPDKFGKQVGGDILSNKKTYLFLKALELSDDVQKQELLTYFGSTDFKPQDKITNVTKLFNQVAVQDFAKSEMNNYFDKAISYINQINVSSEKKQPLIDFATKLMIRES
jgi:geranylgeranyl diphosphate synthase type II